MPEATLNGAKFYYQDHGSGFPVVFTHGLGGDHSMWMMQIPAFKNKYRVVVWDCRGHGRSEVSETGYSIDGFVEDLYALIRHLGIDKAHFVGLSMGGWITWSFALKYPEICKTITLSDSAGFNIDENSDQVTEKRKMFEASAAISEKYGRERLADMTIALMFAKEFIETRPEIVNLVKERIKSDPGIGYARTIRGMFIEYWESSPESVKQRLGTIKIPTLVLVGDKDQLTPVPTQQGLHEAIPGSGFEIIPGAGHVPSIEKPELWNKLVMKFLENNK